MRGASNQVGRDLAAGAVAVVALVAVLALGDQVIAALGVLGVVAVLAVVRRRLNPLLLSPVQIVVGMYLVLAVAGILFYDDVADAQRGAGINLVISSSDQVGAFWLLVAAAACMAAGAVATTLTARPRRRAATRMTVAVVTPAMRRRLFLLSIAPLGLMILGAGPGYYLERPTYLPEGGASIASFGTLLGVAMALVLGYLLATARGGERIVALAILATYSALLFSLGSRQFAMLPVVAATGFYAGSMSRRSKVLLALGALASFALLPLPLYVRGLDSHGLLPYIAALPDFADQTINYDNLGLNLLIGHGTTATVAFTIPPIPTDDFWTSVSPAPGRLTSWYQIVELHRLNPVTPYPTVGELANYGWPYFVGYYTAAGVVLGYVERRVRHWIGRGATFTALVLIGMTGLFVLFSAQYTTRSATRTLMYCVALDLALRALLVLRRRRSSPPISPRTPLGAEQGGGRDVVPSGR